VTLLVLCEQPRVSHLEHFSLTAVSAFFAANGEKRPKSSPTMVECEVSSVQKLNSKLTDKSKFETIN
jgi:hypothetical protein